MYRKRNVANKWRGVVVNCLDLESAALIDDFYVSRGDDANALDVEAPPYRNHDCAPRRILTVKLLEYAIYDAGDFHVIEIDGRQANCRKSKQPDEQGQNEKAHGRKADRARAGPPSSKRSIC